jgi:hypothetical protein
MSDTFQWGLYVFQFITWQILIALKNVLNKSSGGGGGDETHFIKRAILHLI